MTTETERLPDGDADDEGRISLHTRIDTPNGILPFEATHEPSARIDYIFVGMASGAGRCKPKSSHLFGDSPIDGVWPSDHFGVYVDLHD